MLEDLPVLVEMGRAFFRESGWADRSAFCERSFATTLDNLIQRGTLLVALHEGSISGMASAQYAPAYWNDRIMVGQEMFLYLDPAARRAAPGLGRALLRALEDRARDFGVSVFGMVSEDGLRHEAVAALYAREGYVPVEHTFVKVI